MSEADWERFREARKNSFDPELVRKNMLEFIGRIGRPRGNITYPPGVLDNPWAARWVAEEILRTPISPDRPFRTMNRMVMYMSDIEQDNAFWHLQGGRILSPEDEVLGKLRERIMETLEGRTPDPANPDETEAFVRLYENICPAEFVEGRTVIERAVRRYKYGEASQYNIFSIMSPQRKIDYVKAQLPKLKKYKPRNSK